MKHAKLKITDIGPVSFTIICSNNLSKKIQSVSQSEVHIFNSMEIEILHETFFGI